MKRALITGITGQDGSYLAELLLEKGYAVHGLVRKGRPLAPAGRARLAGCLDRRTLHDVDMADAGDVAAMVRSVRPQECYHLAAASFAAPTLETAYQVLNGNINATLFLLAALAGEAGDCRVFFAATSEMFGEAALSPQNEDTPFWPRSPYGISKLAGYHLVRNYRTLSGLYACSGILYNHESPRRGEAFVTRKIVRTAVAIKRGQASELRIGNTAARRDWGHAADYVRAMWLMLQQDAPEDLVIATQTTHSVAEFIEKTFARLELDWRDHVVVDPLFYRPAEAVPLCGDASRARRRLGWMPTIDFDGLVASMVDAELALTDRDAVAQS